QIEKLFPLGLRYWEDIQQRTKFHIESLLTAILNNTDHKSATLSINNEQKVKSEIGNYYFLGERELQVRYSKITHYYSISNLKYLLSFSVNDKNEENQNHLQNVKKIYNDL